MKHLSLVAPRHELPVALCLLFDPFLRHVMHIGKVGFFSEPLYMEDGCPKRGSWSTLSQAGPKKECFPGRGNRAVLCRPWTGLPLAVDACWRHKFHSNDQRNDDPLQWSRCPQGMLTLDNVHFDRLPLPSTIRVLKSNCRESVVAATQ
jgi:hypothetical protein